MPRGAKDRFIAVGVFACDPESDNSPPVRWLHVGVDPKVIKPKFKCPDTVGQILVGGPGYKTGAFCNGDMFSCGRKEGKWTTTVNSYPHYVDDAGKTGIDTEKVEEEDERMCASINRPHRQFSLVVGDGQIEHRAGDGTCLFTYDFGTDVEYVRVAVSIGNGSCDVKVSEEEQE